MSELSSYGFESVADGPGVERLRALARKHWLGLEASPERKAEADRVRSGYFTTAMEYYRAALRQYESLTLPARPAAAPSSVLPPSSRQVLLFLAYSTLWEAFRYLYNAAAYTDFARNGREQEPFPTERAKIDHVLREPVLPAAEVEKIVLLRNGEAAHGAIQRMCSRHSRELEKIAGETDAPTMTDMDAFLQGAARVPTAEAATDAEEARQQEQTERPDAVWGVRALDDDGLPIDADGPLTAAKYRSVLKWLCYQIRLNINFTGKSDDSLDDAILIIHAFCLLEPIVGLLLQDSRKDTIFAL
jgi:hypothetical protein